MKASPRSTWRRWLCSAFSFVSLAGCSRPVGAPKKAEASPPAIINFYAAPPVIARGEESVLCYGTENAAEVRIDPPVESLKPALTRCFQVKPESTQDYVLTASAGGATVSRKITLAVRGVKAAGQPPAELIRYFVSDVREASPGGKVTLCYGVRNAAAVSMTPGFPKLPAAERHCFAVAVARTTTFTLEAKSGEGATDRMAIEIQVRP